ncbi:MAG: phenylalanine--tRNA ligase subunit beta [Pseudomonadota bacterium]
MKFTLSWLRDHIETEASVVEIAEVLTDLGLEVEDVVNPADRLGAFRIARVIEAVQHPNADRLRLCRVETWPNGPDGPSEEVQVVCGAPNARTGMIGVFAPVGTHVPGTGVDLKPGVIRGEASNGMLCSERELEISDDHDGIIDLPEDAPLGERFVDYAGLNDPMIEIAITPNRQDALGVRGIARDLAARGLGTLKIIETETVQGTFPCPIPVSIEPALKENGCPHFTGRVIRGVRNGPSPRWLQDRLKAIGLRPISTLVDITNFFTYDQNRPLHVFDADKVVGALRVHPAAGGETIVALDDKSYSFAAGMMAISDDNGPESIAGVMGGAETGVTEATVNVFLESAWWDPLTIAATGRQLKINSDAKYRFERGVDPQYTLPGLEAATRMILDLCGGEASEVVADGAPIDQTRSYKLDTDHVQSLVGMTIPAETQRATLNALGFRIEGDDVFPPSWRADVRGSADLVEEVARIASLTKLEAKPMPRTAVGVTRPILTPMQKREAAARRRAAAQGYNECVTYGFIDAEAAALFGGGGEETRLSNPISSEMSHMRPALLPGLLRAAARNQARGFADLALFEVGAVFAGGEPEEQETLLSGLLVGRTGAKGVHGAGREVDLFDAKSDAEAVLAAIGAPSKAQIIRGAGDAWHPGRHGMICLGPKKILTVYGEVHPKILAALDVKGPAVAFTVHLGAVPAPRNVVTTRPALQISDLQAVERDFAFVVGQDIEALTLVNAAAGADKSLIESVRVFDQFEGGSLGAGMKSLAITVRLQPQEATLTEEEIEAVGARIVDKVARATGGVLRG